MEILKVVAKDLISSVMDV